MDSGTTIDSKDKMSSKTPLAIGSSAIATSTPFEGHGGASGSKVKPDVSQLFQNIGSKLGWFDHGDLDQALQKLSKSAKRKPNKSARKENSNDDSHLTKSVKSSSKKKTKEKQEISKSKKNKENIPKTAGLKLSGGESPLVEIKTSTNTDFENGPGIIHLRKSSAHTDLTSRSAWQASKRSVKKLDDSSRSSSGSQSDSPSFDFGDPVRESTRIHSRKSIENILDITNISNVSSTSDVTDLSAGSTDVSNNHSRSGDDSYKQLNIQQKMSTDKLTRKTSKNGGLCDNMKHLSIRGSIACDSKGDNPVISVSSSEDISIDTKNNNQLYVTACEKTNFKECIDSDLNQDSSGNNLSRSCNKTRYIDCEGDSKSSCSDGYVGETIYVSVLATDNSDPSMVSRSSSSYCEVQDASTQMNPEGNKSLSCFKEPDSNAFVDVNNSKNSSFKDCLSSDSGSFIEVIDVALQTSTCISDSEKSKHFLNTKSSLSSDTNQSKHDVSTDNSVFLSDKQEEFVCLTDSPCEEGSSSSSYVQVQDTSVQVGGFMFQEKKDANDSSSFEKLSTDETQGSDFSKESNGSVGSNNSFDKNHVDKTQYFDLSNNSVGSRARARSSCHEGNSADKTQYFDLSKNSVGSRSSSTSSCHGNKSVDITQYFDLSNNSVGSRASSASSCYDKKSADKTQYFDLSNNSVGSRSSSASSCYDKKSADKTQYFDLSNNSVGSRASSASSCNEKTSADKTQYFDLSKNSVGSRSSSASSCNDKKSVDITQYFDLSSESNVSKKSAVSSVSDNVESFSHSAGMDDTKFFSDDDISSSKFDGKIRKNLSDSDHVTDLLEETRYFDLNDGNMASDSSQSRSSENCVGKKKSAKTSDEENFVNISSDEDILPVHNDKQKPKNYSNPNQKLQSYQKVMNFPVNGKSCSAQQGGVDDFDDSLPDPSEEFDLPAVKNKTWRKTGGYKSDSSSSDDDLEAFFQKMKTPVKSKISKESKSSNNDSLKDFIVDDDDLSSEEGEEDDDDIFYISTTQKLDSENRSRRKRDPIVIFDDESSESENEDHKQVVGNSESDDSNDDFKTEKDKPKIKRKENKPKVDIPRLKETPKFSKTKDSYSYSKPRETHKYSFLKSLSPDLPEDRCDQQALRYVKTFKKTKDELLKKLFKMYNETVFDHQLPENMEVIWNKRLLQTAGYCAYKRTVKCVSERTVRLEMSDKVCDTAERVRDTLIHEMCHAAVWLLNGKSDGHGPYWKYWAKKANLAHPEIPVIARCHNYSITYKYTYECSKCGYRIGRHSKSLDTKRKVCGYCEGVFVLSDNSRNSANTPGNVPRTPRTPNKFAMFVKENYGSVKKSDKNLKHGDVMKMLSKQFAEQNKIC